MCRIAAAQLKECNAIQNSNVVTETAVRSSTDADTTQLIAWLGITAGLPGGGGSVRFFAHWIPWGQEPGHGSDSREVGPLTG
jgi:hypothetical protein